LGRMRPMMGMQGVPGGAFGHLGGPAFLPHHLAAPPPVQLPGAAPQQASFPGPAHSAFAAQPLPQHHPRPLPHDATACGGGGNGVGAVNGGGEVVVPLEYANARLWGITSEYENLLNIQRDQHAAALRRAEAEAARLRTLAVGGCDGGGGGGCALAAVEEEVAFAVEAKQKELELFGSLLRMRDRQIGDLQELCEAKQEQLVRLQGHPSQSATGLTSTLGVSALPVRGSVTGSPRGGCPCRGGNGFAAVSPEAERELVALRRDKAELERIVLVKDRQLVAVQSVDPSMGDAPALQLGAQAIQMFHESLRRRQEESGREEENRALRAEVEALRSRGEELEAMNAEKRGELRELSSALTAKMQKVFELETEAEAGLLERRQAAREGAVTAEQLQEDLAAWQADSRTSRQLAEELKVEVADRERRLARQSEEVAQYKATIKGLECRIEDMSAELVRAEDGMAQMLHTNSYKDQLVREMSDQVSASESKLHNYHIHELLSARHRRQSSPPAAASPASACASASASSPGAEVRSAPQARWSDDPWARRSPSPCEPLARASAPQPRGAPSEPLASVAASSSVPGPGAVGGKAAAGASAFAPSRGTLASSALMAQSYRPHPGDAIDARVAEFANLPGNAACKALFCRLAQGSYLFGTQRATLRLGAHEELQALLGGAWVPLEEFVRRSEPAQGVHLERAREVACASAAFAAGPLYAPAPRLVSALG